MLGCIPHSRDSKPSADPMAVVVRGTQIHHHRRSTPDVIACSAPYTPSTVPLGFIKKISIKRPTNAAAPRNSPQIHTVAFFCFDFSRINERKSVPMNEYTVHNCDRLLVGWSKYQSAYRTEAPERSVNMRLAMFMACNSWKRSFAA
jgi:hypothetical protein